MSKGGALSVREVLLKTLEDLGDDDFKKFKWFLRDSDILGDLGVIPRSQLEKADRKDTVDKIIQTYNQQSVEVVKKILEKINRADLVETLSSCFRTGERGHHVFGFHTTEEGLKKYEKFTVKADEVYKDKEPIDGGSWWWVFYEAATCCTVCEENCHYPGCTMAWSPGGCEVMKNGRCTVCTRKCPVSAHVKEKWIYVNKTRKVQKILKEVKEKYEENKTESESSLENLKKKIEELQKEKDQWLEESFQHVVKKEDIPLNVDSVSTHGVTEKVQKLEEMKSQEDERVLVAPRKNNTSRPHDNIISKSVLIQSGSPAVYQLKPKKEKIGTIRRMTLGEKDLNKTNRTILLVGETGTGKSTLINTLVNYTMGVKWEDDVWFQIVEEEKRSQSESQTSDVIVYEIFGFEDKTLPYSLTIIDTPGYGNTRGTKEDEAVKHRLFDLFRSEDGVHEINAVGLVLKATECRVTDRLRYIFDSVMSLFGKDMEKNIVALITHSDGLTYENALQALEDAKIKCAKNEDNEPVYFLFNNHQNKQRTKKNEAALNSAWSLTTDGMSQFTDFLKETEPQKMMTTVEELNSQITLTACIHSLQQRVGFNELKQKEIQQTEEGLKKNEQEMKNNEKDETASLSGNLKKETEELQKDKDQWLEESFQHVVTLEQIALNADSLSTLVHLDFLIEKMKEKGDTEKVQKLEEMKRRVNEGVLPALGYECSKLTAAGKEVIQKKNTSLKYENIISKIALIQSGSPAVYQLKPKKEKIGTIRRMTLGEKDLNKTNRTILLVGETVAGKSTLINTLVNYTMGVKWEDDVWFQIVEEEKRSQSESQTSDVIVYQIFGFEDKTLPYSLTIINTPGYGDTRGTKEDEAVKHRLLDLFRSVDGVHEINAVGLVLKATENRVSDRLRYIFDSVLSLFGKNMEKNIVALITHSDGLPPENVLQALEDANIKCAKDEDNELVYFLFNNRQSTQRDKKTEFALKNAWSLTTDGMSQFTDFLKETEPQKMTTTVQDKGVPAALRYRFSKLTAGKEVIQKNNTSLKYDNIISKSVLIQSGSPAVYQLKPKKEKIGTIKRMTLGKKDLYKTNRTILLVGETVAGKSTLINTLVNYTMGVKWEDDVWFQIVEEEHGSQSESQTSDVIVYEIFGFEDETLPYSLTIIDTPGYGDTRGIEQDDIISHRLLDLFRSEDGVHEINAVGLVLRATESRLNDRLRYIFDSVLSLFGKDVEKNIVPLITHSNGRTPKNVLKTLEAANIKCATDEKNQPVYFLFDNCQGEDRTEDTENLKCADTISTEGLRRFTDFLEKTEPQKLKITVDVLNERIRLTACIHNLKERVEFIELKQKEIQQTEEALKKYEQEMKNNEKFTVEVDEIYKVKQPIDGGRWWLVFYEGAVCCTVCKENCHHPGCIMGWKPGQCEVMKDGRCTSCTKKCPVSDHVKEKWIYVNKIRKVQKISEEVKEKYEKNKTGSESRLSLLVNLKKKTEELQKEKDQWLEESFQHVVKLEQIALNTDSLSTLVHLDFLIEKMKEKGDTEKVQKLEEMKRRVDKDKGVLAALRYGFSKLTVGKELMK